MKKNKKKEILIPIIIFIKKLILFLIKNQFYRDLIYLNIICCIIDIVNNLFYSLGYFSINLFSVPPS